MHKSDFCGSLSYSEPLCIQSRKPFPGTFLPENLEKFFAKNFFFFFFIANLDSASKVGNWFHPPPPPHTHTHTHTNGNFGF